MSVHEYSKAGFAKGTNELYNTARANYPPEALSLLHQEFTSDPLNIVEIASGTGLFTRALLRHPEWEGIHSLRAIEPSEGMRETFSKHTVNYRVTVSEGTFDDTGIESGWADMIVIAHAFHWCLDYEAAAAEFARVLKPGGTLALIWNHEDRDVAPWLDRVRNRVERDEKGSPHWRTGLWRQLFDAPSYAKFFASPKEQSFQYRIPGTLDGIVARGLSSSRIATLSAAEKKAFVEDVRGIVEEGEGMSWIDQERGVFEYPHKVDLVTAKRV